MNAVYPLILGVVTKVYDDIMDAGFEVPANVVSIVQSLIIFFLTLTALGDFYFSFACLVISGFNSGFDNPFWKSIFPICALLVVMNLDHAGRWVLLKMFVALIPLAAILFGAYIEELLFPEEVSPLKLVSRAIMMVGFACGAFILELGILPIPSYGVIPLWKASVLLFSHMIISVANISYLMYRDGGVEWSSYSYRDAMYEKWKVLKEFVKRNIYNKSIRT
jgi:hypothetical protein